MVSGRGSTPSTKNAINSTSLIPPKGRLGYDLPPSLNTASLPLPVHNDASSGHYPYPTEQRQANSPDYVPLRGAASSDHHNSVHENDIVIAIMGHTGSGKSSFVNTVVGRDEVSVSNDLRSQTQEIQAVRCAHPNGRQNIVLIDTPGFNHTSRHDMHILMVIAHWLRDTYQDNVSITGILYLHRISDVRFAGSSLKNLAVFNDMCGNENMKNIVLVTTMWDEVQDQSTGSEREGQLRSDFWRDMIGRGSRTCRFQGTHESAWEIINGLDLERSRLRRRPLQIQREMVECGLSFHETTAAKTLCCFFVRLGGGFKKVWNTLRNGTSRMKEPNGRSHSLRYTNMRP